ncbi:MAG TPA: amidohydrolase family protein [Burkholderiales bacterium]|nr:amidohydrolase family protein [Burkholderiales bacterium]
MPVVDTHAHWYAREFVALLEREAADNGAAVRRNPKGNAVFELPGIAQKSVMKPDMIEPRLMIEAMDERRIDAYVLSLTNPMVYWAPPQFGLALSRTWNDASSAVHCAYPDRFIGTMMLPLQAPALALPEIERAAKLKGVRALYMATHINGRNLDDPSLWPVYEKCEALCLAVLLHPLYPCGGERIGTKHFLRNLLGNPYEVGIAAASLVFGGVMDAFPKLKVMLPQAGGTFPWLIGRMDHGHEVREECRKMKHPPSAYLERFYYDTITHHPRIMRALIDLVGAERVVLGSDYNQDMSYERPVAFVDSIPGLTARERCLILQDNAARLLAL